MDSTSMALYALNSRDLADLDVKTIDVVEHFDKPWPEVTVRVVLMDGRQGSASFVPHPDRQRTLEDLRTSIREIVASLSRLTKRRKPPTPRQA